MEAADDDGLMRSTSCGALAWRVRDGKLEVLLIKQFSHKDAWGIPKGHVKDGETLEQCALREVKEEAGVAVTLGLRLPDVVTRYRNVLKTVASWLAKVEGDDAPRHDDPDSEVADARWFDAGELPTIYAYQRGLIEGAVRTLTTMPWCEGV